MVQLKNWGLSICLNLCYLVKVCLMLAPTGVCIQICCDRKVRKIIMLESVQNLEGHNHCYSEQDSVARGKLRLGF